jgi:hypothetical protein
VIGNVLDFDQKVNPLRFDRTTQRLTCFWTLGASICALAFVLALPARAQTSNNDASTVAGTVSTANLVRWTGSMPEAAGREVEVSFALYQDSAGGDALWNETQTVKVGSDGRFTVLLGATSSEGLPQSLFKSGEARWIEVRQIGSRLITSSRENAIAEETNGVTPVRSLLGAAPYAIKSVDAETLGGRPANDYVTLEELKSTVADQVQSIHAVAQTLSVASAPTGSGTAGLLPMWTAPTTLGSSLIAESGTNVGIGTTTPATMLDVNGATTLRGSVSLLAAAATLTSGINSPALQLGASSYSSISHAAVPQNFVWQAASSGNNTANPSAKMNLLFASGTSTPAPTGLSISANGLITFAPGQTFPVTSASSTANTSTGGTTSAITAVTAGPGLAGGGSSGNVTLALSGPIATSNGGTGAGTPAEALANLGGAALSGTAFTGAVSVPSLNGIVYANPHTAGTTTAGINEALDSFGAAPACGTIILPYGVYSVSSTIGGTHTQSRQGCIVQGQGAHDTYAGGGTLLRWTGAANGTMMDIQNCYYCQSKDLVLDGNSTAGVGHSTSAQSGPTLLSFGNLVENIEVENIKGSPGNAFQLVSPSGLMVDSTTYKHVYGQYNTTCFFLSGINTTDTSIYGQSLCNSTSYGIYLAPGTAASIYDMAFSGSATLFYVDNQAQGLTCTNCYSEEFKTFLTANGTANTSGAPQIAFYHSAFNAQSTGVIGTYTQNGTLSFDNSGLNSSVNGATFLFNPVGSRMYGYTGLLKAEGMKWGNITLDNEGAVSGNGQLISNDTFGGASGGSNWYPRTSNLNAVSTPSIYDGRPMAYLNSPLYEADGTSSNVFSHYPSYSGGTAAYNWYLNKTLEGGWNLAGYPAAGEWDAGIVNSVGGYKLAGAIVLPSTLTGYHGTSATKVQLSDGTGVSGNVAVFAPDGSLTNGSSAALLVSGGTVTGAVTFNQGVKVPSGYGLVNSATGGGITLGSDSGVDVVNGSNVTFAKFLTGGLSLGVDYVKTAAPVNGAIIEGNVGIGTSSPLALLSVGSASAFQVDSNGLVHQNGGIPTTSAGTITGTNAGGYVNGLKNATSLTITFAHSGWAQWASCVANSSIPSAQPYVMSISKTAVTFGFAPLTGTLYYHCDGN